MVRTSTSSGSLWSANIQAAIGIRPYIWSKPPTQTELFDQPELQEDNKRLLKTIDAVTGGFGKQLLQVGEPRKPR